MTTDKKDVNIFYSKIFKNIPKWLENIPYGNPGNNNAIYFKNSIERV
jgi:hypothetical protein